MSRDPISSDYPLQTVAVVDDMHNGGFYDDLYFRNITLRENPEEREP